MTKRLVLFDCDGTLVDGQVMVLQAMRTAFAAEGLPIPSDSAIRSIIGLVLPEGIGQLLEDPRPESVRRLVEGYREAYRALRTAGITDPVFDGIPDLLHRLHRRGATLGIVTGKSRVGTDAVLAARGWTPLFTVIKTADDGPGKPDPAIVLRALAETGVPASDAVVVGDTRYDMAMARAAEVDAIGVAWGYHPPSDLLAAGARTVATAVPDLGAQLGISPG